MPKELENIKRGRGYVDYVEIFERLAERRYAKSGDGTLFLGWHITPEKFAEFLSTLLTTK